MKRMFLLVSRRGFANEVELFVSKNAAIIDFIERIYNDNPSAWTRRLSYKNALLYSDCGYANIDRDDYCEYWEAACGNDAAGTRRLRLTLCEQFTDRDYRDCMLMS